MSYPKVIIDLKKLKTNVEAVVKYCSDKGIEVAGVTKGFCADNKLVDVYVEGGVKYLADSRVENLKKLKKYDLPKIMLRLPMISEVDRVVELADISLNSEYETIKALSEAAKKQDKTHKIILMVDLGDLREGYFKEDELYSGIEKILKLDNIKIHGIGTNMACYGGIIPSKDTVDEIDRLKSEIENRFDIKLEMISGGNSASLDLIEQDYLGSINNFRLGDSLITGKDAIYDNPVPGSVGRVFNLEVEVIEVKVKPSVPIGEIGRDAFGQVPTFEEKGDLKRIIAAIGRQDTDHDTMIFKDEKLELLGGSSDHLLIDGTYSDIDYKIGDKIKFELDYAAILRAMTSEYVYKEYIE